MNTASRFEVHGGGHGLPRMTHAEALAAFTAGRIKAGDLFLRTDGAAGPAGVTMVSQLAANPSFRPLETQIIESAPLSFSRLTSANSHANSTMICLSRGGWVTDIGGSFMTKDPGFTASADVHSSEQQGASGFSQLLGASLNWGPTNNHSDTFDFWDVSTRFDGANLLSLTDNIPQGALVSEGDRILLTNFVVNGNVNEWRSPKLTITFRPFIT